MHLKGWAVPVALVWLWACPTTATANGIPPAPRDLHTTVRFDNLAEYPDYVFIWEVRGLRWESKGVQPAWEAPAYKPRPSRWVRIWQTLTFRRPERHWRRVPERYFTAVDTAFTLRYHPGGLSPLAVLKAVYDSAHAALDADSDPEYFYRYLRAEPRVLHPGFFTPYASIERCGEWCWSIEDVLHIVRLDNSAFEVVPVKAVYHFRNGSIEEVTYSNKAQQQALRGASFERPLPPSLRKASLWGPAFYGAASALCALAMAVVIMRRRRAA